MKTVGKIVLGGVILMVLAVGGCFALVGGVANEVDKSMKEDAKTVTTVKYEVDADGSSVGDVTYSKSGSGQTAQENGAKLPWSKTVKIKGDPTLDTYTVLAQNQYSGKISCKISVDGKVVNENESSGQYALVDCTYTQDLDESVGRARRGASRPGGSQGLATHPSSSAPDASAPGRCYVSATPIGGRPMKITRSKDGVRRATLRIDHRLGRQDFVDTLCLAAVKGNIPDVDTVLDASDLELLPEKLSRKAILESVKSVTAHHGYDAKNWWTDDVDDVEDELRDWAEGMIDNHFPEFDR